MNKKHILICDDEVGIRESLKLILKDYRLTFCSDSKECLGGRNFDLLILDIKMPKLSSLGVLRQVKEKKPDLKVIIVTGYEDTEIAAQAIQAGAVDYIIKPFEAKELLRSIEKSL